MVGRIGTNKTQVLHRMRMRQLQPRQPPTDIRITPEEWKPDPEVSLKHDDLYARARECEYEKPIFDAENSNTTPPNSPEIPVQSDLSTEETWNTSGSAQVCSPEICPQTKQLDVTNITDTYRDMKPDVKKNSEQSKNSPTNPHSSKIQLTS